MLRLATTFILTAILVAAANSTPWRDASTRADIAIEITAGAGLSASADWAAH